jgi:hypothetical protein
MSAGDAAVTHVTDEEAEAIVEFAATVVGALGLPRWTIMVMEAPTTDEDDAQATVKPVDGRYVAQMHLNAEWMTYDDETRRQAIVHEVLHLIHARVNDAVSDAKFLMHDYEYDALWARYQRETELMVDHLALFLDDTRTLKEAWDKAHDKTPPSNTPTS